MRSPSRVLAPVLTFLVATIAVTEAALETLGPSQAAQGKQDVPDATDSTQNAVVAVKLWRMKERVHQDGGAVAGGRFYVGRVSVGSPQLQELVVTFDTSSGQVVLPSWKCQSPTCLAHRRYGSAASTSAIDINTNGSTVLKGERLARGSVKRDTVRIGVSTVDMGDGNFVGELVYETLCVDGHDGHRVCTDVGVVAATEMSEVPFRAMPQDGTIGLGLSPLSINSLFSFFSSMTTSTVRLRSWSPQFALFLGRHGGELSFGGYDPVRLAAGASGLAWSPVVRPEEGYWQLSIKAVRVGNLTLDMCQENRCRGIIDSSASRLGVPAQLLPSLRAALSPVAAEGQTGGPAGPALLCRVPDLHLELEGLTLTLRLEEDEAEEGVATSPGGSPCTPSLDVLMPLSLPDAFANVFVLGIPVLQQYYAVFDWGGQRVGLGRAAADTSGTAEEMGEIPVGPFDGSQQPIVEPYEFAFLLRLIVGLQVLLFVLQISLSPFLQSTKLLLERIRLSLARLGLSSYEACIAVPVPAGGIHGEEECVICLGTSRDDSQAPPAPSSSYLVAFFSIFSQLGANEAPTPCWCRLQCGHHFHDQCIFEWLRKAPRCPVCRYQVLAVKKPNGAARIDGGVARTVGSGVASLLTSVPP